MSIKLDKYTPLMMYLSPASIPQIVAHIQDYLVKHPILSVETIAEIIVQSLQEHPELINGEAIPISADSAQSIKAYIDALPALDTYTKAEINALLLGKQDTLTFDQAPTPGSSNPVTSSGIITAMSALQSALETQINLKADSASTYTKTQVDTLLEDKADADDVYSKNTMDAKLLEVNTDIDNLEDDLSHQSQQIGNLTALETTVKTDLVSAINEVENNLPKAFIDYSNSTYSTSTTSMTTITIDGDRWAIAYSNQDANDADHKVIVKKSNNEYLLTQYISRTNVLVLPLTAGMTIELYGNAYYASLISIYGTK